MVLPVVLVMVPFRRGALLSLVRCVIRHFCRHCSFFLSLAREFWREKSVGRPPARSHDEVRGIFRFVISVARRLASKKKGILCIL